MSAKVISHVRNLSLLNVRMSWSAMRLQPVIYLLLQLFQAVNWDITIDLLCKILSNLKASSEFINKECTGTMHLILLVKCEEINCLKSRKSYSLSTGEGCGWWWWQKEAEKLWHEAFLAWQTGSSTAKVAKTSQAVSIPGNFTKNNHLSSHFA